MYLKMIRLNLVRTPAAGIDLAEIGTVLEDTRLCKGQQHSQTNKQ